MRGGKLAVAALPPLAWEVDPRFPVFLHYEKRKAGSCSFTAALIAALPPLASAVKSIFWFSSALRGGKLEIAFLQRVHAAEIFQSDFLSFFPLFFLFVGHRSGLSSTKSGMDMCE